MSASLERVRAVLQTTPARWRELIKSLPADLLAQPPIPGEWSAAQCLQHMLDTERIFQYRLQAFKEGRDFPAFNPDQEGTLAAASSAQSLAHEFTRLREQSLQALAVITETDFSRQARHAELGLVTLGQMLNEWAAHDLNHTVQAERAMMQPFLRDCGPWRVYFADHIMEP